MSNLFLLEAAGGPNMLMTFLPMILILIIFYFMLIRPQSKKDKALKKMRDDLQVADEITTLGGIVGRVLSIKEDTVLFETGSDRTKLRVKKWAVQEVEKLSDPIDNAEPKEKEKDKKEKK